MLKQPKVYGVDFRNESGLIYCYINGIKQRWATSENSPTAHLPVTYKIEDGKLTFDYYVTDYDRYVKDEITVDIIC
ncbi:hypothetical protein LCGC14_1653200 [marine sediment metagenome]|uniref:Uncharacterized protein n=1 Tax=marine sediment metagenome TaxID=412755 RepID=A0A0F9IIT1_9ZZZZ